VRRTSRAARRILALLLLLASSGRAEDAPESVDRQLQVLLRALIYDKNFEAKAGAELGIGIVHDPSNRASAAATELVSSTLFRFSDTPVKGRRIRHYTIEYTGVEALERFVKDKRISVLYIAPGVTQHLPAILELSQRERLTTTTTGATVPDYVRRGVAVGIRYAQDRPQIHINLSSSRAEGSDFPVSIVRAATIHGPR
jgi:hypothetical protein